MEVIIGIDLGTTNSVAAFWNKSLNIIKDKKGNKSVPSIVSFTKKGKLCGEEAKNQLIDNPKNTIYDIKRLIGRKYSDEYIQNYKEYFTYDISNYQDNIIIKTNYLKKIYTPEEISAIILAKIKNMACDYLKTDIKKAVITIPAYFNDSQRQATKNAAKIAGLECVRMLNEPTAAALAYGLDRMDQDMNVLVYDLGGGTLDVSLLNINQGIFRVIATNGNNNLGGEDFDEVIINHILEDFCEKYPNLNTDYFDGNLQKLRTQVEKAKINLSYMMETKIYIPKFYYDPHYEISLDLYFLINRGLFENICQDLFMEALRPVDNIMNDNNISINEIDEIVLVGGATRMPKIKFMLHNYFNKTPNCSLDPDYAVATGAAIQAYLLSNSDDPFCQDISLLDVIPLSLGIASNNGQMSIIIPRNSTIPTRQTQRYTTEFDYQEEVTIDIYEGERKMVKDNFHLGSFILSGITKEKKGIPDIRVTINVDVNGITNISAIDNKSNIQNKLTITGNKRILTDEQIEEMIKEAEINEKEDKLQQKLINYYYRFIDMYDMIKFNLFDNIECHFGEKEKNDISNEINTNMNYFEELVYYYKSPLNLFKNLQDKDNFESIQYDINQIKNCQNLQRINDIYKQKLNVLEKKYQAFLTKMDNYHEDDTKAFNLNDDMKSGLDIDQQVDTDIDIKRLNTDDDNLPERKELYQLCDKIENIINSDEISEEDKNKLENYANNTIMWMNLNITIPVEDYIKKIEETQIFINNIIENQLDTNEEDENIRDKLMNVCQIMKTNIENNSLPFSNMEFNKLIYETFEWINKCDNDNLLKERMKHIELAYIQAYKS